MSRTDKKLPANIATTTLERHVRAWLNEQGTDYSDGWRGALRDLQYGGCSSGMVSHLIYTRDCVAFYKKHRVEIAGILRDMLSDTGLSVSELFGDKWDDEDPLADDTSNQNLLAWFAFEETANRLENRA